MSVSFEFGMVGSGGMVCRFFLIGWFGGTGGLIHISFYTNERPACLQSRYKCVVYYYTFESVNDLTKENHSIVLACVLFNVI